MRGEAIGKLEKARGVRMIENGRVAERFNVPDSKSGVGVTLPWVQIPPRPRFHVNRCEEMNYAVTVP